MWLEKNGENEMANNDCKVSSDEVLLRVNENGTLLSTFRKSKRNDETQCGRNKYINDCSRGEEAEVSW